MNDGTILPTEFGHWLAGLIDGEGSFSIARNGSSLACRFYLIVRRDDVAMLREIQSQVGFGKIYFRSAQKIGNPSVGWYVQRRSDCKLLVSLLQRFPLRSKKAGDFALWKRAVHVWTSGSAQSPYSTQEEMESLKVAIELGREYVDSL